ncbi:PREDICTED: THAP domain-containing protein 2-like isoform X2 [Wasmannia auropunctata]|uniref:THAP domain-containing protein 2-like isoform X2 n=1 Tax=Wasmannia auropunctata TaxID=64793 RepID=UPI0005EF9E7C|nr:PREDICTED: THAP domain-containing protein 2-like isoform X2 [Wasmannia auropunctata]
MLVRCIADGCESTTDVKRNSYAVQELKKVDKITFHTFPSDPVRRAEWIRILRLENKIINMKSRVCSLHFEEKYMDRISYFYPKLRKNAVPHIFEKIYNMDTDKTVLASPKFLNTRLRFQNVTKKRTLRFPYYQKRGKQLRTRKRGSRLKEYGV